jgi:hypothetical protein
MKIRVSTRLASSKISWIDIQFDSSKFTAVIRGSSSGSKDAEDTPVCSTNNQGDEYREKAHISKYKNFINSTKKGKAWYLPLARADILFRRSVMA